MMVRILQLVLAELRHRWFTTLALLFILATCTAACCGVWGTLQGLNRETKRLTRDLGFNIRILPKQASLQQVWSSGVWSQTLPTDAIERLAADKSLRVNHLVAMLHRPVQLEGHEAVVTGISSEYYPPGAKKSKMIQVVKTGEAQLGAGIANQLDLQAGSSFEMLGRRWGVEQVAPQTGSADDFRITVRLDELQQVTDQDGLISEVQALDCLCLADSGDTQSILQEKLSGLLPEAQLVMKKVIADARARQRTLIANYIQWVIPGLLTFTAILLALTLIVNVAARTTEIGLLRALGYSSLPIASIFVLKAVCLGIVGGSLGYWLGSRGATEAAEKLFLATGGSLNPGDLPQFAAVILWAAVFAAACSLVPAAWATTIDPAKVLRND